MGTSGGSFRRPAEPIRGVESLRIGLAHHHSDYISQTAPRASPCLNRPIGGRRRPARRLNPWWRPSCILRPAGQRRGVRSGHRDGPGEWGTGPRAAEAEEDDLWCQLCSLEPEIRYPASGPTVSGKPGASWGLPLTCLILSPSCFLQRTLEGDGRDVSSASQRGEVKMDVGGKKEGKFFVFVRLFLECIPFHPKQNRESNSRSKKQTSLD